ncbi:MAG TPA: hypothetical protein VIK45_14825 [Candidatus Dormibacteraeota bacterium]
MIKLERTTRFERDRHSVTEARAGVTLEGLTTRCPAHSFWRDRGLSFK